MLQKTKKFASRFFTGRIKLTPDDVLQARQYIQNYWPKLERKVTKGDENQISLPKPYLVPAYEEGREHDFNEMYYWDSYFMARGLLDKPHQELVTGMLDDLVSMFERFKIIPNASRTYLTGRSQPPLLTSFIFDLYDTFGLDKKWLKKVIEIAEEEYHTVWMGTSKPNARQMHEGLSRYYDINYLNDLAEAESGWDMTPRFGRKVLDYLPVDLNALLFKYEMDFARAAQILGHEAKVIEWQEKATTRRATVDKLMWSESRGMYFDYNYVKARKGEVYSLAAYYPLWVGMASKEQADKLAKSLWRFEEGGGLTATDAQHINLFGPGVPMQWAYPNGWAPLHYIVVKGLERYGYTHQAHRIALKWLKTNLDWFNEHGVFMEKYNVVKTKEPAAKGVYPTLAGFGWTNAIFEIFCREYVDNQRIT